MTNFDYRKFLKENKSTFHSTLTEGQFSWMTQDTNQQIGSEPENTLRAVYMFDNKGNKWVENRYEGYGDFGGKDYYELLAQMNGMANPDRSEGISLAFSGKKGVLYPALVVNPNFDWKNHDFTQEAEHDPNQSWYTPEENEDDYDGGSGDWFVDMDKEEDYDEEELEENITEAVMDVATVAQAVADAFTADDKLDIKYVITPGSVEGDLNGGGFDLDAVAGPNTPGEDWEDENGFGIDYYLGKYAGGSFVIKNEGDVSVVKNAAMRNAVIAYVTPEGEIDMVYNQENHYNTMSDKLTGMKEAEEAKKSNKMKKSELKELIKSSIMKEMYLDVDNMEDAPESEVDFLAEVDAILAEADEEVAVDDTEVAVDGEENIDVDTTTEVDPNVKAVQDALTQAQAAAQKLGDPKLTDQIGNTITFFTRAHVVDKGAVAEGKEELNEDLTSALTALIISIIAIPAIPITGALLMGLIDYLFNDLPDQRAEAKSLRLYKGPDKQEKVLALAKEIESKLSPGKKKYLKTLVNRVGAAKLEDKAKEYRELDRYAQSQKLDENLATDIEAALKDLPIPSNEMEEGKKEYYKDAEADDAEHIKALEKDMEDDKKSSMNESMFPLLKRILK